MAQFIRLGSYGLNIDQIVEWYWDDTDKKITVYFTNSSDPSVFEEETAAALITYLNQAPDLLIKGES